MKNKALAVVEANSEAPLLPRDCVANDTKRSALRLLDDIGLQICTEWLIQQIVCILNSGHWLPRLRLSCLSVCATRQIIHADQLARDPIEDRREFAWERILVVLGMICSHNVHVALEEPAGLLGVICAVDPGIHAHSVAGRELQFLNFSLDRWMAETEFLNLQHFINIDGSLDILGKLFRGQDGLGVGVDQGLKKRAIVQSVEKRH